jgi:ubiquinone/menaquinone biosynthesis C-methylase UbiE
MGLDESMDALRALTDPTRVRLLAVLDDEELTVAELQRVLDVPQSRVSTHLARLKEAGLALDRVDGPHRYYRRAQGSMPAAARAAWTTVSEQIAGDPQLERDRARRLQVLASRRGGQSWVDRVAGSLDRHYSPGRTWESLARALVLTTDLGDVADLGAGDGAIAELLAPAARRIVGVDKSARMIEAGRDRLKRSQLTQVELIQGDMHAPPLPSDAFDFVLLQQSLQYAERPADVISEVGRLLRRGGRALIVTLQRHDHGEVRDEYGHVHLGFTPRQLTKWINAAGLDVVHVASAGRERRPPQFEALALLCRKPNSRNGSSS